MSEDAEQEPEQSPTQILREAMNAAREVIEEKEGFDPGIAIVGALPPDYDRVQYVSNLDGPASASLLMATGEQIMRQVQAQNGGGHTPDDNIIQP